MVSVTAFAVSEILFAYQRVQQIPGAIIRVFPVFKNSLQAAVILLSNLRINNWWNLPLKYVIFRDLNEKLKEVFTCLPRSAACDMEFNNCHRQYFLILNQEVLAQGGILERSTSTLITGIDNLI